MTKVFLGDILDIRRGTSLSGKYYAVSGDKIRLTLGNFNYPNGGFKENTSKQDIYFTGEVDSKFILRKGDIITPLTEQVSGLLGETAIIPTDNLYIQSGDIGLIIPDESKLQRGFAYYLISSAVVKKQLGAGAQQTKIRHTTPHAIKSCAVWLPEMEQQLRITNILGSIDKKIEINKKKIAKLEAIAREIYNYWFVQYEFPDENGKPYKSNGGQLVWNGELKREVPVGWTIKTIQQLVELHNGINYDPKDEGNKIYKIVNVRNISDSKLFIDESVLDAICLKQATADKYLLTNDDILIARSGTPGTTRIINDTQETIFCGFIICCSVLNRLHKNYILYLLKKLEGTSATNTGGSVLKNVNQDTLNSIKISLPPPNLINAFNLQIDIFHKQIATLISENHSLHNHKEHLLPLLMNGQVTVT